MYVLSSFANTTGLSTCLSCGPGTLNGVLGQSACQVCGVGTFNNVSGQSSALACRACSVGRYSVLGQSTCLPCGIAGSYPTFALSGQPLTCLPCPAGAFCPDGATPPLPCPIGFACPGLGLSFPQVCNSDSFCPVTNLTSPLPCPAGTMSTPGATECIPIAVVSTLAGSAGSGQSGQGAPYDGGWIDGAGTAAAFRNPYSVAVDASGNVLVADTFNHRVRRVTPSGGTRLPMRKG